MNTRKSEYILLLIALALYWPLFTLFTFPPELFPQVDPQFGEGVHDALLTSAVIVCVILHLRQKKRGHEGFLQRRVVLVALFLMMATVVIVPYLYVSSGQVTPMLLFWVYPLVVGAYSFVLTLALVSRILQFADKERLALSTGSLLLSFIARVLGVWAIATAHLVVSDSNYATLLAAGLAVLLFPREQTSPAVDESQSANTDNPSAFQISRQPLMLVVILLLFLLGSGVFLSAYAFTTGNYWFEPSWVHYVAGLVLYASCTAYCSWSIRHPSQSRPNARIRILGQDSMAPLWFTLILLCLAVLYLGTLFDTTLAGICREFIMPARPLSMVLLWLAALSWAQLTHRDESLTVAALTLPAIILTSFVSDLLGTVNISPEALSMVVNVVVLACSFAITVILVAFIIRFQIGASSQPFAQSIAHNEGPHAMTHEGTDIVLSQLRDEFGLSEREAELMELICAGNTQKRIAEKMFVSINSVQTYAKSLYRKLDIHSKQELIDLVTSRCD